MASRIVIPSYHNGFYSPRRGGVARYPNLWRGCVGAWCPSLGATGSRLFDWSLYGNHGTLTNMDAATDWIISGDGRALDFDGTNDYIKTTTVVRGDSITASVWCAINYAGSDDFGRIMEHGQNQSFTFTLNKGVLPNKYSLQYDDGGGWLTSTTTVSEAWTWLCFTYDFGSKVGRFYINGVQEASGTKTGANAGRAWSIFLGGHELSTSVTCMAGKIDDARLYNRALTASEVRQLYSLGRGGAYALADDDYKAGAAAGGFKAAWIAGARQTKMIGGGIR